MASQAIVAPPSSECVAAVASATGPGGSSKKASRA